MAQIEKFEDLISWQKAQNLAKDIYRIFPTQRDFSFRDQIQRAAVSISNNIAEGFERSSNKEFKYFLFVAKGSCGEFRSMLYIAKELEYITEIQFNDFYQESVEVSKLLSGLIKKIREL